ncbi:hypothetical protein ACFCX4_02590 [Kitasatospora sp. NPDC056327]|uniref:hypothetical protein n=1 Tax=Kitasatospora sp. NPDC056327 TaxID=3345785 RepID=UPI0035E30611
MSGVLGLDVQYSHTVPALRETGAAVPLRDGHRALIPNAVLPGGAWGSPAAEEVLGLGPATPERLFAWRRDPWSPEFLRGLRDRSARYLGLSADPPAHGYRTVVCAGPDTPDDAERRCEEAGLGTAARVTPTDALLCRRLAEPQPLPRGGTVLAVVCAERWTALGSYRLVQEDGRTTAVRSGPPVLRPEGAGAWTELLAGAVLARSGEGTPARDLLALLDGALECASRLDLAASVPWQGPLAERLSPPLVVWRDELARSPAVLETVDAVRRHAVAAAPDLVLLGGSGAVWPFPHTALGAVAPVWRSSDPALDLAAGAAWWPALRDRFGPAPAFRPAPAPLPRPGSGSAGAERLGSGTAGARTRARGTAHHDSGSHDVAPDAPRPDRPGPGSGPGPGRTPSDRPDPDPVLSAEDIPPWQR